MWSCVLPSLSLTRGRRQYLEENAHLIEAILQNQNLGRLKECVHYQQQLQQNLIFLATHADEHPELQPLVFAPPTMTDQAPRPESRHGGEGGGGAPGAALAPEAGPAAAAGPASSAEEQSDDTSIEGLLRARGVRC